MKNIKELSEQEAKEILNFVFPENKLIYFKNISCTCIFDYEF